MDLHGSFSSAEAAASVYVVEDVNSEYMRFPLPVLLSPLREARKLCGTRAKSGSRAQARVFAEVHWTQPEQPAEAEGHRRDQMSIGASLPLSCPGCVEQDGRTSGRTLGQHLTDLP